MKNIEIIENYCKKMGLKEVIFDETCCLALGMAAGLGISAKKRRPFLMATAIGVAAVVSVPLITGVLEAIN